MQTIFSVGVWESNVKLCTETESVWLEVTVGDLVMLTSYGVPTILNLRTYLFDVVYRLTKNLFEAKQLKYALT